MPIWATFTIFRAFFCTLSMFCSSTPWAVWFMMIFCSDASPCIVTGVTKVRGDRELSWDCGTALTSFVTLMVNSGGGFGIFPSTLSGLEGNRPQAENPALMFLGVKALYLAWLYRNVKCSLPIVLAPTHSSRSASSRYAVFKGAKTATSQGYSLWEVWEGRRHNLMLFSRQCSSISSVSCVPNQLDSRSRDTDSQTLVWQPLHTIVRQHTSWLYR